MPIDRGPGRAEVKFPIVEQPSVGFSIYSLKHSGP